ncbi:MAG: NUDIX hydrolase [Candidatus Promineifilaceae bacterium]
MDASLVVAALIRQLGQVLLVREQGPGKADSGWRLPGGAVELGESLLAALKGRVAEETGLTVVAAGRLAYAADVERPEDAGRLLVFGYDVYSWKGEPQPAEPDAFAFEMAFYAPAEAAALLELLPWRSRGEPAAAYLRGQAPPGVSWHYRQPARGDEQLVGRS